MEWSCLSRTGFATATAMCTLRRCKSTPTRKAKLIWMTSHYGPGVDNYKGSSSWVRSAKVPNYAGYRPCANDPWTFEHQINRLHTDCLELLLCQVSTRSDQGFSFYRGNRHIHILHTHIHIVTMWSLYPRRRTGSAARIIKSTKAMIMSQAYWNGMHALC